MGKHIEVIARGLVIVSGDILLCRNVRKGYSYLPGGHVEFGEGAKEALAREFLEEAGLRVRVGDLIQADEFSFTQGGKRRHELNLVFHVELPRHRTVASIEPHIEFHWLPKAKVRRADIRPSSAKALLTSRAPKVWASSIV